jgi:uncharacterized membrane protein YhaH (DUF805 family)
MGEVSSSATVAPDLGEKIVEWMLMPLKRYADFSGRSRRKEYWMFLLLIALVYSALGLVLIMVGFSGGEDGSVFGGVGGAIIILLMLFGLAIFIPSIAVVVRRFHDQDKSGWFYLLNFIPYVGPIIVLVFMCLEGTRGPNRFGEDPKGGSSEEIFA